MKKCPHIYDRPITCVICGEGKGTMLKVDKNIYKHKVCPPKSHKPKTPDPPLVIPKPRLIRVSLDDPLVKQIKKEKGVKDGTSTD